MKWLYGAINDRLNGINRNMRCIEIDMLQRALEDNLVINRNMRCIEIDIFDKQVSCLHLINRNMRCIEITQGYSSV